MSSTVWTIGSSVLATSMVLYVVWRLRSNELVVESQLEDERAAASRERLRTELRVASARERTRLRQRVGDSHLADGRLRVESGAFGLLDAADVTSLLTTHPLLISGPAGTGKSTLASLVVLEFMDLHADCLLVRLSHPDIDGSLHRIRESGGDDPVILFVDGLDEYDPATALVLIDQIVEAAMLDAHIVLTARESGHFRSRFADVAFLELRMVPLLGLTDSSYMRDLARRRDPELFELVLRGQVDLSQSELDVPAHPGLRFEQRLGRLVSAAGLSLATVREPGVQPDLAIETEDGLILVEAKIRLDNRTQNLAAKQLHSFADRLASAGLEIRELWVVGERIVGVSRELEDHGVRVLSEVEFEDALLDVRGWSS